MKLIIGNRNYSSWSLRAWMYLFESGLEFETLRIPLFTGDWHQEIRRYSPAGRVPVLIDGEVTLWDSLAIMEYLRERYPGALAWPAEVVARALARSVSAEMHSGFMALRDELPQNIRLRTRLDPNSLSNSCRAQIKRIADTWSDCRSRFEDQGPGLFGEPCIADVMFAPVALRFRTYGIEVDEPAADYCNWIYQRPAVVQWTQAAEAESESLSFIDERVPAADSPLVLG